MDAYRPVIALGINLAAPIVGNMLLPGAGGLIGGAVGGASAAWISGGEAEDILIGAVAGLAGGAVGAGLSKSINFGLSRVNPTGLGRFSSKFGPEFYSGARHGMVNYRNFGQTLHIALYSTVAVLAADILRRQADGSDPVRPQANGSWVGSHVAVMGQGPFQAREPGNGFLYQPDDLSDEIKRWYGAPGESLATTLARTWEDFGVDDPDEISIETIPALPESDSERSNIDAYEESAARLRLAADRFESIERSIREVVADTAQITKEGRERIDVLINTINGASPETRGDTEFLAMLTDSMEEIEAVVGNATARNEGNGARILQSADAAEDNGSADEGTRPGERNTNKAEDGTSQSSDNVGSAAPAPSVDSRPVPPPRVQPPPPVEPLLPAESRSTPPPSGNRTSAQSPETADIDTSESPTVNTKPPIDPPISVDPLRVSPAATASTPRSSAPAAVGVDPSASLLPTMMQMAGQVRNSPGVDRGNHSLPQRAQRPTPWSPAPQSTPPPPSAGGSAQTMTPPVVNSTGAPAHGASAPITPTPGTPADRIPDSDDTVEYSFPDGRKQRVTEVIAQALDAAFANNKGTDARAAYTGTPAHWTADNMDGIRIDPSQLSTGDVALWTDRTGILVVFGTHDNGTLEIVSDGALAPFRARMRDCHGDFGLFSGFVHPQYSESLAASTAEVTVPDRGDISG